MSIFLFYVRQLNRVRSGGDCEGIKQEKKEVVEADGVIDRGGGRDEHMGEEEEEGEKEEREEG